MDFDLERIHKIYGKNIIFEMNENHYELFSNIEYLESLGFSNVFDIVEAYPYSFLIDCSIFQSRVDKLILRLGRHYSKFILEDVSLWSEIDDE